MIFFQTSPPPPPPQASLCTCGQNFLKQCEACTLITVAGICVMVLQMQLLPCPYHVWCVAFQAGECILWTGSELLPHWSQEGQVPQRLPQQNHSPGTGNGTWCACCSHSLHGAWVSLLSLSASLSLGVLTVVLYISVQGWCSEGVLNFLYSFCTIQFNF